MKEQAWLVGRSSSRTTWVTATREAVMVQLSHVQLGRLRQACLRAT